MNIIQKQKHVLRTLSLIAIAILALTSAAAQYTLGEHDGATYRVDGVDYNVEVFVIGEEQGQLVAKLRVNGEITQPLRLGDTAQIASGEIISISAIDSQQVSIDFAGQHITTTRDLTALCRDVPEHRALACQDDYNTIRLRIGNPPEAGSEGIAVASLRTFEHKNTAYEVQVKDITYTHTELWVNGELFAIKPYEMRQLTDGSRIQLLGQDRHKKIAYIQLFTAPSAQRSASQDGFPYSMMQNNQFIASVVVGDRAPSTDVIAATDIMSSVQKKIPNTRTGLSKLASEITRLGNLLSIGTPCDNPITAKITGVNDCHFGLLPGQGYIGFYTHNNAQQVVVSGYSPKEVRIAARALAHWKHQPGQAFIIEGTLDQPSVRPVDLKRSDNTRSPTQPPGEGEQLTPPSLPDDSYHLRLQTGWNLVSLPGKLVKFKQSTCSKKPVAFVYLKDGRSVGLKEAEEILGNNLRTYLAEHAFWIYSFTECEQPVLLEEYTPTLSLELSWNMIPNKDTPCTDKEYWWDTHKQQWTMQKIEDATARVVKVFEGCTI